MPERKPILVKEVDNKDSYSSTSRYKSHRYFERDIPGIGTRTEPETWRPRAIPTRGDDLFTEVGAGEVGRLDLVSLRVYKTGSLWWVIAFANKIIDPFSEVTSGLVLRYPTFENVVSTLLT